MFACIELICGNNSSKVILDDIISYAIDIVRRHYGIDVMYTKKNSLELGDECILVINGHKLLVKDNYPSIADIVDLIVLSADLGGIEYQQKSSEEALGYT